jgi:predicted transcriptional regulator
MSKTKRYRLGDLQLKIMKALWDRGEAGASEVQDALGAGAGLAYTTIATMLRKMEDRGLVKHRLEGRRFIYRAVVAPETVTLSMANDLLDRLFEGSLAGMLNHLLTTREVSREELFELEQLIARKKEQP